MFAFIFCGGFVVDAHWSHIAGLIVIGEILVGHLFMIQYYYVTLLLHDIDVLKHSANQIHLNIFNNLAYEWTKPIGGKRVSVVSDGRVGGPPT